MNWFNIKTQALRSPEILAAPPAALGTWVRVTAYCCESENGGVIKGAVSWNDRQWMTACGVTASEVKDANALLKQKNGDIIVSMYPGEKESEVKEKRRIAKENGKNGGRPRRKTNEEPTLVSENNQQDEASVNDGKAEREREREVESEKEIEQERESNSFAADGEPPSAGKNTFEDEFGFLQPEPQPAIPASKRIKWAESSGWAGISDDDLAEWGRAFPACNIERQLQLAHLWLKANPSRRKSNYLKFLNNWLQKSQDRGGDKDAPSQQPPGEKDEVQMLMDGFFNRDSDDTWTADEYDAYSAISIKITQEDLRRLAVLYRAKDGSLNEWQRPTSLLQLLRRYPQVRDFSHIYRPPSAL